MSYGGTALRLLGRRRTTNLAVLVGLTGAATALASVWMSRRKEGRYGPSVLAGLGVFAVGLGVTGNVASGYVDQVIREQMRAVERQVKSGALRELQRLVR